MKDIYLWNVYEDKKYFMYSATGYDEESALEEFRTRMNPRDISRYSVSKHRKLTDKEIEQYARYSKWLTDYISNNQ